MYYFTKYACTCKTHYSGIHIQHKYDLGMHDSTRTTAITDTVQNTPTRARALDPVYFRMSSSNARKHTQQLSLEPVFLRHCLFDAVCNKLDALCFFGIVVDEEGPALDSLSIVSPALPPLSTHLPQLLDFFHFLPCPCFWSCFLTH